MNVSKNWIQRYLNFDLPEASALVAKIGSQLGEVEGVTDLTAQYSGATIVRVVECTKLEDSDHLNVCFVDDGGVVTDVERREDGLVQVVCGAPNVAAGVWAVWLPPGAIVPSTFNSDPFVLGARKLRGVISNGMLASAKELAIGDSHEGLLLLTDANLTAGDTLLNAFSLNDHIIDIENKMLTHRPDGFGQLGIAREVAGIFGQQFTSPDWYTNPQPIEAGEGLPLRIVNEVPDVVPRFMAIAIKDVEVRPSPLWMQTLLSRVGIRPINNLVDVTNFVMVLTGQPLHAYDYDKVSALTDGDGAVLTARYPHQGETITLLSSKTITPREEAILIATDTQAIGLAGVMGGANTEVDGSTKNIILECATFDMYSIRRTSMAHGLFTDAVTRFSKGQSPLQNAAVLAHALSQLQRVAGGSVASVVCDDNHAADAQPTVIIDAPYINARLGLELSAQDMAQLLTNVEFDVSVHDDELTIHTPFWRTDIEIKEDIVEEVGRLYGFDKLPLELPKRQIHPTSYDAHIAGKARIRNALSKLGANEVLTYSFVHGKLLEKAGQDTAQAFSLSNALSPDLQYYRLTGLPSLLDKIHGNSKSGHHKFALFELAKGHNLMHASDDEGIPSEFDFVEFVYTAKKAGAGAPFYYGRTYLDALLHELGLEAVYSPAADVQSSPVTAPYDVARAALVTLKDGTFLGIIGELKQSVLKNFKLPAYTVAFTLDAQQLITSSQTVVSGYVPLSRFPKVEQDICFRVANTVHYADLYAAVSDFIQATVSDRVRATVSPIDIYQRQNETDYKQITFRISLAHYEKTMTDAEVSTLLDALCAQVASQFSAERI